MAKKPLTLAQIKHAVDTMLLTGIPPETTTVNCKTTLVGGSLVEFTVKTLGGITFANNSATIGPRPEAPIGGEPDA